MKNEYSKCCFDPFKIHKKKVIALICVITKVYLQRKSNVSLDLDKKKIWRMLVSKQFLQVCQISKESEGVRGKMSKNLMI